jgi:ankyrin repeat protein
MASKTALGAAVKAFDVDAVRAALDETPALLEVRDERGRTWLHLVCSTDVTKHAELDPGGSIAIANLLVERGLDHSEAAFTEDEWRATPVWYAVARGRNVALARFLLEIGADPNHTLWAAAFNDDFEALTLLLDHGAKLEACAEDTTPFLGAIKTSHFASAWHLADRGADVDVIDPHGMTALHYMLKKSSDTRHFTDFARFRPRVDIPGPDGQTAGEQLGRRRDPVLRELAVRLAGEG